MKAKTAPRAGHAKPRTTPDENDFAALDSWARKLDLSSGCPLTAAERRDDRISRSVGRPRKPESAKSKRLMISMAPGLISAANNYAKRSGYTLSGLIAESLAEKIKRKAS